jgi:RNA recognition motif-containing protein
MSSEDAAKAVDGLNGKDFGGRALKVNPAQEKERKVSNISQWRGR